MSSVYLLDSEMASVLAAGIATLMTSSNIVAIWRNLRPRKSPTFARIELSVIVLSVVRRLMDYVNLSLDGGVGLLVVGESARLYHGRHEGLVVGLAHARNLVVDVGEAPRK